MCKMGSARQREEMNRLFWLSLNEDFADKNRFAGDQNIAHIMNVALQYPIPENTFVQDGLYIVSAEKLQKPYSYCFFGLIPVLKLQSEFYKYAVIPALFLILPCSLLDKWLKNSLDKVYVYGIIISY